MTGSLHSCGLTATTPREVYCWGYNGDGYFGDGTYTSNYLPQQTVGGHHFEQLEAGGSLGYVVCGIKADGETWCWGYNYYGAVGNGQEGTYEHTPQKIETYKFRQIAPARYQTCGYTVDEKLMCWGNNSFAGQLGTGDNENQTRPVYVKPLP